MEINHNWWCIIILCVFIFTPVVLFVIQEPFVNNDFSLITSVVTETRVSPNFHTKSDGAIGR